MYYLSGITWKEQNSITKEFTPAVQVHEEYEFKIRILKPTIVDRYRSRTHKKTRLLQ